MTWCEMFGWIEFYDRLEQTWLGTTIRESLWLMPGVWAIHLVGLAAIGGSVLVVDMRLLGAGLTRSTPAQVAAGAKPWFLASLALMLATGIPLFLTEAVKCCFNHSFEVKIAALAIGIVFTFAVRDRIAANANAPNWLRKVVGLVSLATWFTVAAAGRWIGFSG